MGDTVAVVGSRSFLNYSVVERELLAEKIDHIVSGGAIGTDTLAELYAMNHGISISVLRPDYEAHHWKLAPLIRNKQIVDAADRVVAFWDGRSPGTEHTIRYAQSCGKPVRIVKVNQQEMKWHPNLP